MNKNISSKCRRCGAEIPANSTGGVCPRCAAAMLQATQTGIPGDSPARRPFTPPTPSELAAKFPQLEILAFIGQGGMGAVYKARQRQLDRVVALKILPPGIGDDPAFAGRFAREAKAMAKLSHPGIVTIHDFGCADGLFYFVMEFVDGVSLRQLMGRGRLSPREALAIVPQICDALQYAHDNGIVHRDVKPENLLLDRQGRVKVADFGLAKLVAADAAEHFQPGAASTDAPAADELTVAGKVMGTPCYMAPEQVEHPAEVDHRADIYALGVVFYQMLTGELPGKSIAPPSNKVQNDVRLDEVVLRALEKQPDRRYQQVSEVKTAVETITRTGRPDATFEDFGASRGSSPRENALAAANGRARTNRAFAAALAALLALYGAWVWTHRRQPPAAARPDNTDVVATVVAPEDKPGSSSNGFAQDIQGAWEGEVPLNLFGSSVRTWLVVKFTKTNETYRATVDAIDAGKKDLPIEKVTYAFPLLRLVYGPLLSVNGTVNADATEISCDTTAGPQRAVLRRTSHPTPVPAPLTEQEFAPRTNSDLQGYWEGTIGSGPDALPLDWKITEQPDGIFRAELDNPMQGALGQPVSVEYHPPKVNLIVRTGSGRFEGTLNDTHTIMTGAWVQNGSTPSEFRRADYQDELRRAQERDFAFASPTDPQGHWKGIVTAAGLRLRTTLDIAKLPDGSFSAALASLDTVGNTDPVPASVFRCSGSTMHGEWKWVGGVLDAELKDGKLTGVLKLSVLSGDSFPITLERAM